MQVRWTAPAAQDLYRITSRIRRDSPVAARKVAKTIYEGCENLRAFPHRGRKGRIEGTRELLFAGLPYIVVYRIKDQTIELAHIYHAAQNWPSPTT